MCAVLTCSVKMEAAGDFVADRLQLHQLAHCSSDVGSCRFWSDCLSLQQPKLHLPSADSITGLIWLIDSLPFFSLTGHSSQWKVIFNISFLATWSIQTYNTTLLKEIPLDILPSEIKIIKHTVSLWSEGTSIFSLLFFWTLTAASSCSD